MMFAHKRLLFLSMVPLFYKRFLILLLSIYFSNYTQGWLKLLYALLLREIPVVISTFVFRWEQGSISGVRQPVSAYCRYFRSTAIRICLPQPVSWSHSRYLYIKASFCLWPPVHWYGSQVLVAIDQLWLKNPVKH